MLREGFADLDELILRCRDEKARSYISEAVRCYKAGAFRQCIVATWIAIVYDFIHKLQELELAGDKNARKKLEEFEATHKDKDVRRALDFERNILDMAKDEFDLITPLEYTDLLRLHEDRNRCAHPSMHSLDQIYEPAPEMARSHLRNAVTCLLQRPPVQGKAAMDRLLTEVNSDYFPTEPGAAAAYFANGPLARPRESLVRNFAVVLTKELLQSDLDDKDRRRYVAGLRAVRSMHREIAERTLDEKLNGIMQQVEDNKVVNGFRFLYAVPDTWQYVRDDVQHRMRNFVTDMPKEDIVPELLRAFDFPPLRAEAEQRLRHVSAYELDELLRFEERAFGDAFADRAVQLYVDSGSFAAANFRGSHLIIPLASYLRPTDVERIIKAAKENPQVTESFEIGSVLRSIRNAERVSRERFDELVAAYELAFDPTLPF